MRAVLWIPEEWPGAEYLTLREAEGAVTADSVVIGLFDKRPSRVEYQVELDAAWQVRRLSITDGDGALSLRRAPDGTWWDGAGAELEDLAGCTEIDIAVTPFTNTLPIRRLGLADGESAEIEVVYVQAPDLKVRRVRQRYTNLGGGLYRYESLASGFTAVIEVGADGLVREYPGLFRQVP